MNDVTMKLSQLNTYFAEKLAECNSQKAELLADDRRDEANLWQIRANIYDIFRTILSVAERTQKNDARIETFMRKKITEMANTWTDAGKKASDHGDTQKAVIEQIKVETAGEIQKAFENIWRG